MLKSNDPYIIDSIGWAYYLIDDYIKAENFLKRAVELMPEDPIVNDHYGDILWKLDRKIQARYFWGNVLNLEETEDEMKNNIKDKLIPDNPHSIYLWIDSKLLFYAKINLALNVTGKKIKLHKIESLISFIDLHDLIYLKKIKKKD